MNTQMLSRMAWVSGPSWAKTDEGVIARIATTPPRPEMIRSARLLRTRSSSKGW